MGLICCKASVINGGISPRNTSMLVSCFVALLFFFSECLSADGGLLFWLLASSNWEDVDSD